MEIYALVQRFFHAEIRKIVLIIGLAVSIIIVFQCFALPYGRIFSPSPTSRGSIVRLVSNANILDNLKPSELIVVNVVENDANDSISKEVARYRNETPQTNEDFDLASDVDEYLDESFHRLKDQNSHDLTLKQRITQGKSLMTGYVASADDGSARVKAAEVIGMVENTKKSEKMTYDLEATNDDGIVPIISAVVTTKGLGNLDPDLGTFGSSFATNLSSISNAQNSIETQHRNSKILQIAAVTMNNYSTKAIPLLKGWDEQPISVSKMNFLLLQSIDSSRSLRARRSSARDHELLSAKQEIKHAHISRKTPMLYASLYQNVSKFERSYEMMEQILKVYIYKEGVKPIFHQPKMRGIYASEGWFMKLLEGNKKFVVRDPRKAHLFYLPFSSYILRTALKGQEFQHVEDLQKYLGDYVELIKGKYKFWNRTGGADHFLVACHDWAPKLTKDLRNCLRVLCNANAAKDFKIGKDATLPVTNIRSAGAPLENLGGKPPSERNILAFFAGGMHGYLRPILLQYWQNKEPDMKIFGPMPRDIEGKRNYREHMKSSKYCISARGYEVHTPRVVEAIYYECVPVIISDNYVPPFFEVLNWEAFAVFIQEKDIPNLRNILLSIPEERYLEMHSRVKLVQQHFLWHKKPVKYDLFHMILHSVWYNRVLHINSSPFCFHMGILLPGVEGSIGNSKNIIFRIKSSVNSAMVRNPLTVNASDVNTRDVVCNGVLKDGNSASFGGDFGNDGGIIRDPGESENGFASEGMESDGRIRVAVDRNVDDDYVSENAEDLNEIAALDDVICNPDNSSLEEVVDPGELVSVTSFWGMMQRPRRPSPRDQEISAARSQIENAPAIVYDQELYAPLFRNVSMFKKRIFSPSPTGKGCIVRLVTNATILNHLKPSELIVVNVVADDTNDSNSKEVARYLDDAFHRLKDRNSRDLTLKRRITQGKSLMTRYVTSGDGVSARVKAAEVWHDHIGMVENTKKSEKMTYDPEATNDNGIVPLISAVVTTKGLGNLDPDLGTSGSSFATNLSSVSNDSIETRHRNSKVLQIATVTMDNYSTKAIPLLKGWDEQPISVSKMNFLLLQSINSSCSLRPRRSSVRDHELQSAKQEIEHAHISRETPMLYASLYQNVSKFESSNMLRTALKRQDFQHVEDLQKYLGDYVELIKGKYKFWNRTGGADQVLLLAMIGYAIPALLALNFIVHIIIE
ncbi:Exostosin-like protein [Corchorus olitorius]|uniref:Exostosin-like protein n=1 Tax=Corchorus olitorius TaxID=93759 RepID=A0A1R3GJM6_9ROSI|nr:Exostosin-like protein [Corchorus olitorius]